MRAWCTRERGCTPAPQWLTRGRGARCTVGGGWCPAAVCGTVVQAARRFAAAGLFGGPGGAKAGGRRKRKWERGGRGGSMLPLSLLKTAQNHPMLVELKNGETYNGHLVSCDNWMNINLREVICTSRDGDKFWRMPECYIRGSTIKYLRIPDEIIDMVKEEVVSKGRGRGGLQQQKQQKGRGAGGTGRGVFGGRGRGIPGSGRGQQEKKPGRQSAKQ
ncbi:U6 snRNA-associated Sm-like protein LSm4 isoform X1 [Alligator mississippiensis]|uniref:U6 snRNA-associated Sm-like protein LSm4 isoform X1 n=1 Tax=Alligator mississippiensis TaxID=8496 RepID=UPI00090733F5|nr:U6 snRNA-associated Sm-like protein LSm4 isoform X1 [Alligator mississippiensis]